MKTRLRHMNQTFQYMNSQDPTIEAGFTSMRLEAHVRVRTAEKAAAKYYNTINDVFLWMDAKTMTFQEHLDILAQWRQAVYENIIPVGQENVRTPTIKRAAMAFLRQEMGRTCPALQCLWYKYKFAPGNGRWQWDLREGSVPLSRPQVNWLQEEYQEIERSSQWDLREGSVPLSRPQVNLQQQEYQEIEITHLTLITLAW